MLSFATEFPVDPKRTTGDFLEVGRDWILGSPHTTFNKDTLKPMLTEKSWFACHDDNRIAVLQIQQDDNKIAALRYTQNDSDLEWQTEVVMWHRDNASWVGIRVSREASVATSHLPSAKKPVLVRFLLDRLGGGFDGELQIGQRAHKFLEHEVDKAARVLLANAGCRLPVIYISRTFFDDYAIDVNSIANDLMGMGHVVVEPSRKFSYRLRMSVGGQNAYGGSVGIYWPEDGGNYIIFRPSDFTNQQEMKKAIISEIRHSLLNSRPNNFCTWHGAQDISSRLSYNTLRESGSKELSNYIKSFDSEIIAKAQQLADAEKEIIRLKSQIEEYKRTYVKKTGITIDAGSEQNFFESEIKDIIINALEEGINRTVKDSRRQHILTALVQANTYYGEGSRMRDRVKDALSKYDGMNAGIRRALEGIGFELSEDGKHFKLIFRGDDRYTFSIATTPSDRRGGPNSVSDINKRLF